MIYVETLLSHQNAVMNIFGWSTVTVHVLGDACMPHICSTIVLPVSSILYLSQFISQAQCNIIKFSQSGIGHVGFFWSKSTSEVVSFSG